MPEPSARSSIGAVRPPMEDRIPEKPTSDEMTTRTTQALLAIINGLVDALVTANPALQAALSKRWTASHDALVELGWPEAALVGMALDALENSARALQRTPPAGQA